MSATPRVDRLLGPQGSAFELVQLARELERESVLLRIERDNLAAAREWAVNRLYPYVLRQAGPLPVPLERIAELAAQAIDSLAEQQSRGGGSE